MARPGSGDRVSFLLQWMVGAAGARSGAVLLDRAGGGRDLYASVGLGDRPPSPTLAPSADGARADGPGAGGGPYLHRRCPGPCAHGVVDADAAMVLILDLDSQRGRLGVAQVGFPEERPLAPADVQRLQVITDHVAAVIEAARHAEEIEARNRELERVNRTLVELDRLKGDFLSMVSHELRTPLTAIIGYTDLLLRGSHGSLNERQERHQVAVKKAAHRLLALVNDLLDVNRLESGRVELATKALELYDVARRAVQEVEQQARQKGVELRLDAPLTSPWVRADADRLHQVLRNLLDNALKFTPGGGRITLRIERAAPDAASVVVEDTGVGIPPEQLGRIWDRFYQVDSSTRRHFGGTGLGLAIVRNLVELHGGRVSVHSDGAGRGSRFAFTLPTETHADAEPAPAPAAPSSVRATERADDRRVVLIVDDEPDNREVIAALIGDDLGHEVRAAPDGEQALVAARAHPDLILLDLRMPGMSGFEVAQRLKQDPATAGIPILAITALADEDDQRAAREAGCIGCITKPFTPSSLTAAVQEALRGAGVAGPGR